MTPELLAGLLAVAVVALFVRLITLERRLNERLREFQSAIVDFNVQIKTVWIGKPTVKENQCGFGQKCSKTIAEL